MQTYKLLLYKAIVQVDQDLHIKSDMLNLIEEKVEKESPTHWDGGNFLNRTTTALTLGTRIDKLGLMNLKTVM